MRSRAAPHRRAAAAWRRQAVTTRLHAMRSGGARTAGGCWPSCGRPAHASPLRHMSPNGWRCGRCGSGAWAARLRPYGPAAPTELRTVGHRAASLARGLRAGKRKHRPRRRCTGTRRDAPGAGACGARRPLRTRQTGTNKVPSNGRPPVTQAGVACVRAIRAFGDVTPNAAARFDRHGSSTGPSQEVDRSPTPRQTTQRGPRRLRHLKQGLGGLAPRQLRLLPWAVACRGRRGASAPTAQTQSRSLMIFRGSWEPTQ